MRNRMLGDKPAKLFLALGAGGSTGTPPIPAVIN